jgi:hypothetical protein
MVHSQLRRNLLYKEYLLLLERTLKGKAMEIAEIVQSSGTDSLVGGNRSVICNYDVPAGTLIVLEWPILTWKQFGMEDKQSLLEMVSQILENPEATTIAKDLHPIEINQVDPVEIEKLKKEVDDSTILPLAISFGVSGDEIYRLLLVLKHNAFESGLYHKLCMINHSCVSNCIKFEPRTGSRGASEVWSVKPISKGEEITISYLSQFETTTPSIQQYLLEQHHFSCCCPRCLEWNFAKEKKEENQSTEDQKTYSTAVMDLEESIELKEDAFPDFIERYSLEIENTKRKEQKYKLVLEASSALENDFNDLLSSLSGLPRQYFPEMSEETGNSEDINVSLLKVRLFHLLSNLFRFQVEKILLPVISSNKSSYAKQSQSIPSSDSLHSLLSSEHLTLLLSKYLKYSFILLVFQMIYSFHHNYDHPSLLASWTDCLNAFEYLQYFLSGSESQSIFQEIYNSPEITMSSRTKRIKAEEAEKEFGTDQDECLQKIQEVFTTEEGKHKIKRLKEMIASMKKEITRLKSLYLLANRCKKAVFVPKKAGNHFWGTPPALPISSDATIEDGKDLF